MSLQAAIYVFFPNWAVAGMVFGFLGLSVIASTLFNGQELRNKQLNTAKFLVFGVFIATWAEMLLYNAGRPFSVVIIVFIGSGTAITILGDWIGFGINRWVHAPGGARGMFWRWLARCFNGSASWAGQHALHSLRPTERRLYELAKTHKEADGV